MNFNSVKYLFSEGLKNLLNNIFMTLASIGVLTACLLIVGFSVLLKENMKNVISFMGKQGAIEVFLKDEATKEQIDELSNTFRNNNSVESVSFTSKEQALLNYSERINRNSVTKEFKNSVSELLKKNNILPPSISVHVKKLENMDEVLKITTNPKYKDIIYKTNVPKDFTNTITEFSNTAGIFGTVLIVALIAASLVIISNTIRATVFTRRREIAIMKQVGATDSFVRFPFFVEGASIGLISAVIAFCLTGLLYKTLVLMLTRTKSGFINSMFSTLIGFKTVGFNMAIGFILGGVAAGSIGSLISLRRYLKI